MLCGVIGAMMVAESVKLITGVGRTLLGRVALFNALQGSWREIAVSPDDAAATITELIDYELFCGTSAGPEEEVAEDRISVRELAAMLDERERGERDFDLIDVREPGEYDIVRIPGARLVPQGSILSGEALPTLSQDRDIVLHCKAGPRSADMLTELRRVGYTRVTQVEGGVLAWVREIEPSLPVY